jgi:hypothetical protein
MGDIMRRRLTHIKIVLHKTEDESYPVCVDTSHWVDTDLLDAIGLVPLLGADVVCVAASIP